MRSRGVRSCSASSILLLQLPVPQAALGVRVGGLLFEGIHPVDRPFAGFHRRGLLLPDLPFAQLVQADIGHNPVQPGMKAAIEPERMQVPVDPEKRFLVHVARILRRAEQVHGQPEHTLVVCADQLLESVLVAALGRPN